MKQDKILFLGKILCALALVSTCGRLYAQEKQVIMEEHITTVRPDSADVTDLNTLLKKGEALYREGALASSILSYQDALKIDPNNRTALLELGKITLETKNWAYARLMVRRLAELDPNDFETRRILMEIYRTYEEPLLEMRTAAELLKLRPNDKELLERISNLYRLHEMFLEQINVLERLVKLNPSEPKYLKQLADLYTKQNNPKKTISTYELMLKQNPRDSKVLKRLARLYGETGQVGKQIKAYEKVLEIEPGNKPVQNALILAYGDALKDPDLPLNAGRARRNVKRFGPNASERAYVKDISTALEVAAYPEVNFTTTRRTYDFNGKKEYVEGIASVAFRGLSANSAFVAEQSIITLDAPKEPELLKSAKLFRLDEARLYRSVLTWQQKIGAFRLDLSPGLVGLISAASGIESFGPHFIGEVSLKYKHSDKLLITGNHDLDYITLTPLAIQRGINRHQTQLMIEWLPWTRLQWSNGVRFQRYSDKNNGKQLTSGLSLDLIKTKRVQDLERYESLDFVETGTLISVGIDYEYLEFDRENDIYPTVGVERDPVTLQLSRGEHVYSGSFSAQSQIIQSFFVKLQGFYGMDNKDRKLYGFDVALEKQLNWRLKAFAGYESSRSPFILNNQNFINTEGRFYIGVGSKL